VGGTLPIAGIDFKQVNSPGDLNNYFGITGAWADFNNDGNIDILIGRSIGEEGKHNSFHLGNGNGTFNWMNKEPFKSDIGFCHGIALGDYNNDGFLDIYFTNQSYLNMGGKNQLYKNNGNGTFAKIEGIDLVTETGEYQECSWMDVNNDGFLDLFVPDVNYNSTLYKGNINGTFTNVENTGIKLRTSYCSWADYNEDGWIDLITNERSTPILFKNNGDWTFTEIPNSVLNQDYKSIFKPTWFDFNNDGHLDIFYGSMNANPSRLFINNGNGAFRLYSSPDFNQNTNARAGITWGDYDNDGDIDIYVRSLNWYTSDLFENDNGVLKKVITGTLANTQSDSCWSARFVDLNNDGFLDVSCMEIANPIFLNNADNGNNWVKINCKGTVANASSIGAKVKVTAVINGKSVTQYRQICSDQMSNLILHFGLAKAPVITKILVKWPSGIEKTLTNVKVNQTLTITEPAPTVQNVSNLNLERLKSDMVFFCDFVNRLSWIEGNAYHKIKTYEIYRKPKNAGDDQFALVATYSAGQNFHDDKFFKADELFTYKIVTISTKNYKSSGVIISN
jgi:hypothetical protein